MYIKPIIDFLAPDSCIGCGRQGRLVCAGCLPGLCTAKASSCFLCNRLTDGFKTCPTCRRHTALKRVVVASHYEGHVKDLIRRLKYQNAVAAAVPLAQGLAVIIPTDIDLITAVPASAQRFRRRGYNQAAMIARALSGEVGIPYAQTLGRLGNSRQVGADRRQRISQLRGQIYARPPQLVAGRRILIVDDVLTTSTTLAECAQVLKAASAKSVAAAVVAKH